MFLISPEVILGLAIVALAQCVAAAVGTEILPPGDRQRRLLSGSAWVVSIAVALVISVRFAVVLG